MLARSSASSDSVTQAETTYQLRQGVGFLSQAMRRGGRLFHHGGILLGDLIHLIDRDVDFSEAARLLLWRCGNGRDHATHFAHLDNDADERSAGFIDQLHARPDLLVRCENQLFDLFGCRG